MEIHRWLNIQFTDDELYQLFCIVDSRRRVMVEKTPSRDAVDALCEKLLPVYCGRHAPKTAE